ncbi:molecular chaperone IbpA [Jannaschia faecimaris]|uniref:Molecular chaperone IbpA n=1 Tax=Jannaschia faecimaris TaxID=1244108 RepID=A0A1H3L1G2_9RHOB|nr:Hsp20 family protein [Jannaschia faecimaris]SDY58253.1 molecular chaperone IbpA [Jannaschia faecimaris]
MRTYDFTPLYRATVGFDRMANLVDRAMTADTATTYPPYNIEKLGENDYRISIAVAGFTDDELSIEARENQLIVTARKAEMDDKRTYLHRGIATRAFEKSFQLADHVQVTGATHTDGMLHIDLVREVPEALKPRQIQIATGKTARALEGTSEAVEA